MTSVPLALAVLLPFGIWLGLLVGNREATYSVRLGEVYYQNFVGRAVGLVTSAAYSNTFDLRARPDWLAAKWVRNHALAGCSAVVWSSLAWDYLLADLRPVVPTPAIYVDEAWLGQAKVLADVEKAHPDVVITAADSLASWPNVEALLRRGYVETYQVAMMTVWVARPALAAAKAALLTDGTEPATARVSVCGGSA
jgi:hypothetical protein